MLVKRIFDGGKHLVSLGKPGISRAQILTVSIGYFLAMQTMHVSQPFILLLVGTYCLSFAAAVGNNVLDCAYDAKMNRTKERVLPNQKVSVRLAVSFGVLMAGVGLWLFYTINLLTLIIGSLTVLIYVFVYTPMKRWSWLNTLVGAIPGALPLLGGWVASGTPIHLAVIALVCTLFCWQMPHFYALSIMYLDDYRSAGFVMLPIHDPDYKATKRQISIFTILMIVTSFIPYFVGYLGVVYVAGISVVSMVFLVFSFRLIQQMSKKNARKLFVLSILYLPMWFIIMILDIVWNMKQYEWLSA